MKTKSLLVQDIESALHAAGFKSASVGLLVEIDLDGAPGLELDATGEPMTPLVGGHLVFGLDELREFLATLGANIGTSERFYQELRGLKVAFLESRT